MYDIAFLEKLSNRFQPYEPMVDPLRHTASIRIDARELDVALDMAWGVGNRTGVDAEGNYWPSTVRSMSVGDVLIVTPVGSTHSRFFAIAPVGFDEISGYEAVVSIGRDAAVGSAR